MTAIPILRGKTVAVTRPEPGELASRLAALGADVVHVPLITIADVDVGDVLDDLASFDWLVVTSANGARRVGVAAAAASGVRLAAVGTATAEVLAELAGRPVDLVPSTESARGLLHEFPSAPARVLLAHADQASPTLSTGLAAAGHDVRTVVAYRTVEPTLSADEAAELRRADAVVLASGSAARAYATVAGPAVVVCIGPATADAARAVGLHVDHVADHPDAASLVELVTAALASTP